MCFCVCSLEKTISDAQQNEAEPCRSLLADDLDMKRCSEKKIQALVGNQKWKKKKGHFCTTFAKKQENYSPKMLCFRFLLNYIFHWKSWIANLLIDNHKITKRVMPATVFTNSST